MGNALRRFAIGVAGLLVLLILVVFIVSEVRWNRDYHNFDVAVATISIPTDEASIARGEHVALTRYCRSCHGPDLAGDYLVNEPLLAVVAAPNLTSGAGGVGLTNTDMDWIRAIRHGVGHDGRGLMGMPSRVWYHLSDEDLGALIAYLKTLPAVDHELPERRIGPMFRVLLTIGQAPTSQALLIDHDAPRPTPPVPGITVAYGQYLAYTCTACHGSDLSGGTVRTSDGELETAPNLTPGGALQTWTEEDFITALRTGRTPDDRQLSIDMPWPYVGQMTDAELQAIWLYLQSLPVLEQSLERTDF
jgi:mono/diheme cytochrome c family protein